MYKMIRLALLASIAPRAFESGGGWKIDANGAIEVRDGNPVWVDGNGQEKTLGADTVTRLNGEARGHRERAERAEGALKAFEGLDAAAARKALETVGKLDAKQLIDAGEVDKVRETMRGEFTSQLTEKDNAISERDTRINNMLVDGIFANSNFIRDDIAIPRDMLEASLRGNFKIEDGKPVAYDRSGNRLMSKSRVGEYADPDEALRLLVDAHPQKDMILKAPSAGGSGGQGGGGARGGGRSMRRGEFDKLSPMEQGQIAAKQAAGEITIVD